MNFKLIIYETLLACWRWPLVYCGSFAHFQVVPPVPCTSLGLAKTFNLSPHPLSFSLLLLPKIIMNTSHHSCNSHCKGGLPTYSVKDQVQIEHWLNFGLCQTVAVTLPVKLSITNLKIKPLEKGLDCNVRYGREENASLAALSVTRSKSPRAVALPPATGTFFGQQQQQQPPTAHLYHHLPPYSSAPQRTSQRDR